MPNPTMSMEPPPPILEPNLGNGLPPLKPLDLARCGGYLSLVAPAVILLLVLIQPG